MKTGSWASESALLPRAEEGHLGERRWRLHRRRLAQQRQGARAGAEEDDVSVVVLAGRGPHDGTVGVLPHGVHRRAAPDVEVAGVAQGLQAMIGGQHARCGFEEHGAASGDPAEPRRRLGRREPLRRGAGRRQGRRDGMECTVVAERHLARGVQEPAPLGTLEVQPEVPGP